MNSRNFLVACLLALPAAAFGQTGFSISGGLSNFDCTNHCDEPCDEFEIEIEGIHPEDVVHTYTNSNYHAPTVTLSASGTSTIIDYRNPTHATAINSIEHFGISLRQLSMFNPIRVRWMKNGQPATVNGVVPVQGGGTAPATQPMLPSITVDMGVGSGGGDGVACSVTNNDAAQAIWIKRRAKVMAGTVVTLEALMPNDPVVTTTVQIDAAPVFLAAGATIEFTSDLVEIEDNQSVIFSAEYYQDIFGGGLFNQTHVVGPALGNVMTASIASPDSGCDVSTPVIIDQPQSVTVGDADSVDLRVDADGNDLPLTYQWLREGVPLVESAVYHGVHGDELSIDEITSANEGFYSVRITNACGTIVSNSALVFVDGHNVPPPRPPVCTADFDHGGAVTIDDLFLYFNAWFTGDPAADINSNGLAIDDLFLFLNAWFIGC